MHKLVINGGTKPDYCIECRMYKTIARCKNCKQPICARCHKNKCRT